MDSEDRAEVDLMDALLKDAPYILITMTPVPGTENDEVPVYEIRTMAGGGVVYEGLPDLLRSIADDLGEYEG